MNNSHENKNEITRLKFEVDKAIADRQHSKIIELCCSILVLEPNNANAYLNKGIALAEQKNFELAIKDFTNAIKYSKEPTFESVAHYLCGSAYTQLKDYKNAIDNFTNAINLNPYYTEAFNSRGIVYVSDNQNSKAIDDFKKVIGLDNYHISGHYNLGHVYAKENKFNDAIDVLTIAKNLAKEQNQLDTYEKIVALLERTTMINHVQKNSDSKGSKTIDELKEEKKKLEENNINLKNDRSIKLNWLFGLSVILYGGLIAAFAILLFQTCYTISSYQLLPFILPITLLLSPLIWKVKIADHDQKQCANDLTELGKEIAKHGIFLDASRISRIFDDYSTNYMYNAQQFSNSANPNTRKA